MAIATTLIDFFYACACKRSALGPSRCMGQKMDERAPCTRLPRK